MHDEDPKVKLSKAIRFLQWQAKHTKKNLESTTNERKRAIFQEITDQYDEYIPFFEQLLASQVFGEKPLPISSIEEIDSRVAIRPQDLAGLPDEVKKQLLSGKDGGDDTEIAIQEVIDSAGGVMSLDQIIIGFYRKKGEVLQRNLLNAKLYRMTKKGLLHQVKGKKGIYCTFDPSTLKSKPNQEDDILSDLIGE